MYSIINGENSPNFRILTTSKEEERLWNGLDLRVFQSKVNLDPYWLGVVKTNPQTWKKCQQKHFKMENSPLTHVP